MTYCRISKQAKKSLKIPKDLSSLQFVTCIIDIIKGKRTSMLEWSGGEFSQNGVTSTYDKPVDNKKWPMLPEMKQNIKSAIEMFKNDQIDMAGNISQWIDWLTARFK